jgi:hypothetical protein
LLKQKIKPKLFINLLKSADYLKLKQNPDHLSELTYPLKKSDWVIIDEIQRIPELLTMEPK